MPREDDVLISNGRLLDNFHRLNDEMKIDFFYAYQYERWVNRDC